MQLNTSSTESITVEPLDSIRVELLVGEEVLNLLEEEAFQAGWDGLYHSCPWATVFQSRAFVATWYRLYQKQYLPIVVKAEHQGHIIGLLAMTMALPASKHVDNSKKKGRIVGAGHFEAEYQAWLTNTTTSEDFIKAALTAIRNAFPLSDIIFRYLPPEVPLGWIENSPQWQRRLVIEPFRRPLMDMSDPELPKLFRKGEFRNKLNRLKRLGEFSFEQIKDFPTFSDILDELTVQYDFRQGAMFNKNRFRENPLKAKFLLALFEQGLLHVTVLRVSGNIVAAIVAVAGKDWVHLGGINIHTPLFANYYSPGFVHFLMLGQQLAQEGVAVFDLTPGGDSYKDRMATRYDHVFELTVTNNPTYRIKREIRKQFHDKLIKAGLRPMSVELSLQKRLYLLKAKMRMVKEQGIVPSVVQQVKGAVEREKLKTYLIIAEALVHKASVAVHKNSLKDLLDFNQRKAKMTRWEFLEDAMRRFEDGESVFTWAEEGVLLGCAWLKGLKAEVNNAEAPEGATVIHGLYCHADGSDRVMEFVAAVAEAVARERGREEVYVVASVHDKLICQALGSLASKAVKVV